MWADLSFPWQACLELAWEAYCDDCFPIGAVVVSLPGEIVSRGRNRIFEKDATKGKPRGNELAHAQVEALGGLEAYACSRFTSTDPCPMCMGSFYISGLRTLRSASRDPWAGSTNLLGTTWYLCRKPIRVFSPSDPVLETVLVALFVEQICANHGGKLPGGKLQCQRRKKGSAEEM